MFFEFSLPFSSFLSQDASCNLHLVHAAGKKLVKIDSFCVLVSGAEDAGTASNFVHGTQNMYTLCGIKRLVQVALVWCHFVYNAICLRITTPSP